MQTHVLLLFCVLIATHDTRAMSPAQPVPVEMLFRNWTTQDDLPDNHIHAITRTRDGFLWIGTSGGLARFDGVRSKNYGLHDGLGGVVVRSLLESRDGTLWVGTLGGGLSAIRNGRIERTYTQADGLPSASVTHLLEDAGGVLWAANGVGLVRFENGRFVPITDIPGNGQFGVQAWYRDRSDVIWVALWRNGLWCWKNGNWSRPENGAPPTATAFCEDASGRLWIGHDAPGRLWRLGDDGWRSYSLPPGITGTYPCALASTPDGTIWMTLYDGGGICGLRNDGQWVTPKPRTGLPLDPVETIIADSGGQLWMGSYSNGIYALAPPNTRVVTLPDDGTNELTALLEPTPGEIVVGTKGRGWFRWKDGESTRLCNEPGFSWYRYGNAALRSRNGSVWLATNEGLHEFRETQRVTNPALDSVFSNLSVLAICEDREEGLWAGTSFGHLFRIRGNTAVKVSYGARLQSIDALVQEPDGTLWIGSRGDGLYRLKGMASQRFGRKDGLGSELVTSLYLTPDGILWAGTIGGGLARRDGNRFVSYTTDDGLPDNTISQIIADDEGRLWLGTNRGLAVVSMEELKWRATGKKTHLHSLTVNRFDGMLAEECTKVPPIKMSDGRLAFATTCGFVMLRPSDFHTSPATPPVWIDEIKANGQPVYSRYGKLSLAPGIERLEIQFTGIHFPSPKHLRFRCRLDGLESGWNEVGAQRSVEYRNLAPGSYLFEVATTIGNGHWSTNPARLELILAPAFWQTWTFRTSAILATTVLIASIARWRERIRTRQKILAFEQRHAIDIERARIARDLHDDVGATLTQVALLSELAQSSLTVQPGRASAHINEIFTTAKAVTRALDEIVWAVNPAHDTMESFAQFLGTFVQNYARTAGLQIRLDMPEVITGTPLTAPVRHHLYLATKEILHNVVKHADATEIRLSLKIESHSFRLSIADNGHGHIPADSPHQPGADGLHNLQQRIKQIGGTCMRTSAPGRGTTCEIQAPLQ